MGHEIESPKNILGISYHPRDMIALLERKGHITTRSLAQERECGNIEASWIINDLMRLQVISSGDDDWIINKERMVAEKAYRLTEAGRQNKDKFEQRKVELRELPSTSKAILEMTNDISDVAPELGLEVHNLSEMDTTDNQRLTDLINRRKLAVLREFSPDELRQLAIETKQLKRHQPPDHI